MSEDTTSMSETAAETVEETAAQAHNTLEAATGAVKETAAEAVEKITQMPDIVPFSDREIILTGALITIMVISLISFFLKNRADARTHVSLSMFSVLIGGFALFMAFKSAYPGSLLLDGIALFGLLCMFKLMNQFEVTGPPPKKDADKKSEKKT